MEFDWNLGPLADGLGCYRREEFFAAHEHWEILWRASKGPEKSFLQGLIQLAGGFHHLQRNNLQGATALLRASLRRLESYPASFAGVELAALREEMREWLRALEVQDSPRRLPYPQICVEKGTGAEDRGPGR
jgi:predicted metal-dependent hydrolase